MTLPINDTFTRANETPLGGNYTTVTGTTATINLSSNALIAATLVNSEAGYYWNADTFPNNQWGQLDGTTWTSGGGQVGVIFRANTSGVRTYYIATAGSGLVGSNITRRLTGTKTVLASESSTTWTPPFTVYADIIGQVITVRQGGPSGAITVTFNDTGGITSGAAGLFMTAVSTFADVIADNFRAGAARIPILMNKYRLHWA